MFVVELATELRQGGLATQLLREARAGWGKGQGRTELQVHTSNRRALEYYGRLGMCRSRWWEEGMEEGGPKLRGGRDGSLYEPRIGYQTMQVGPGELEAQLARRAARREPTLGRSRVCRCDGGEGSQGARAAQRGAGDDGQGIRGGGMVCQ